MSTIKSSTEHLTLNADGASKDIKFQANGVEKASISSAGAFTSTSIDATKLSGALPAIDGSALTGDIGIGSGQTLTDVKASRLSGTTYTNSTGKSIMVSASTIAGTYSYAYGSIDGVSFYQQRSRDALSSNVANATFIVPAGSTYRIDSVTNVGSTFQYWFELR